MTNRLKCRWCPYNVPAYYRTKDGGTHTGYTRLSLHVSVEHRHDYADICDALDVDDPDVAVLDESYELRPGYVPSDPTWQEDEALA